MTTDFWEGTLVGGLAMTFVWGLATLVFITAIRNTRTGQMDGGKYTGDGSDSDR